MQNVAPSCPTRHILSRAHRCSRLRETQAPPTAGRTPSPPGSAWSQPPPVRQPRSAASRASNPPTVQVLNIINFRPPPPKQVCRGAPPPAKQPCPDPKSAPPPPACFSSAPPRRRAPCAPRAPEWGALPADEKVPASPGRDPAATSRECQFLNVTSSHLIIFPRRRLRRRSVQFLKSAVKLPAKPVTGFL